MSFLYKYLLNIAATEAPYYGSIYIYIYIFVEVYISVPQKGNQSRPTLFFALLKIIERPGFGLCTYHQAL
jgi:hypothetical protein